MNPSSLSAHFRKNADLYLIFGLFILLRSIHVFSPLHNHDDFYTMEVVGRNIVDMHSFMLDDVHLPLFFYILKFFEWMFSFNHVLFRFVNIGISVWGLFVFFLLLRELFDRERSIIGLLLVGLGSFHIAHTQNIRMYALVFLCSAYLLLFFVRFFLRNDFDRGNWWGWVLSSILLLHVHFFGYFLVFITYFLGCYYNRFDWLKTGIVLGMGSILSIIFMGYQVFLSIAGLSYGAWMPPTQWVELYWIFSALSSSYILTPVFILLFIRGAAKSFKDDALLFKVLALQVVFCVLSPLVVSIYITPMFALRYFMIALPSFIIVIIYGFDGLEKDIFQLYLLLFLSIIYHTFLFLSSYTLLYMAFGGFMFFWLRVYALPIKSSGFAKYFFVFCCLCILVISTGKYFDENSDVYSELSLCKSQISHYMEREGIAGSDNFYAVRWLNDWVLDHKPISSALSYFSRPFEIQPKLVNERWVVNSSKDLYFLNPPLSQERYNYFYSFEDSGHLLEKEILCRGYHFRKYSVPNDVDINTNS